MSAARPEYAPRILLVDDDVHICALVTDLLEYAGYVVTALSAPEDAVRLLGTEPFDLVLSDGFGWAPAEPCDADVDVLAAAGATTTPVALFTARRWEPETVRAAGYVALMAKPFDINAFDAQVARLVAA